MLKMGRQSVGKVPSFVITTMTVLNTSSVINMTMFTIVFARCSSKGSADNILYMYFRSGILFFMKTILFY